MPAKIAIASFDYFIERQQMSRAICAILRIRRAYEMIFAMSARACRAPVGRLRPCIEDAADATLKDEYADAMPRARPAHNIGV